MRRSLLYTWPAQVLHDAHQLQQIVKAEPRALSCDHQPWILRRRVRPAQRNLAKLVVVIEKSHPFFGGIPLVHEQLELTALKRVKRMNDAEPLPVGAISLRSLPGFPASSYTPSSLRSDGGSLGAFHGIPAFGQHSSCMIWGIFRAQTSRVLRGRSTSASVRRSWASSLVAIGRSLRYWAKKHGVTVSKLCYADKLAFVLTPGWLYLPMARATGELAEYMAKSRDRQAGCASFTEIERTQLESCDPKVWLRGLQTYTRRWVEQHRNGGADTWTVVAGSSTQGSWIGME
jgi:hypothetical protein